MNLPTRITRTTPLEPVISVDGVFEARGLHLSHWPGNRTPRELRHELSTGSALAFARLAPEERERLAGGAAAIVNNHFDTDGVCAVFATRHPERALPRAGCLLAAAAAGDFFRAPDDEAWALDAIVTAFGDEQRSPIAERFGGRSDVERWNLAQTELLERLPAMLDGDLEPYRALYEPVLADGHADLDDLARCERREEPALDLSLWTAPHGAHSGRGGQRFDPGRHPLFGSTEADRVLVLGPGPDGTTARLLISTWSWFDIDRETLPRPDLVETAARLNEREGSDPREDAAWRAQSADNASPELWFGADGLPSFAQHNPLLAPSRLAPEAIRDALLEALRPAGAPSDA